VSDCAPIFPVIVIPGVTTLRREGEAKKIPDKILGSTSRARGGLGNATEHSARCEITFQKRVGWQSAFFIAAEMKLKTASLKRVKWQIAKFLLRRTREKCTLAQ